MNKGGENMIINKFSSLLARDLVKITDISNSTGVSRVTLARLYYRRTKVISFDVLAKLCKFFNCSVGDILEYVEDTKKE